MIRTKINMPDTTTSLMVKYHLGFDFHPQKISLRRKLWQNVFVDEINGLKDWNQHYVAKLHSDLLAKDHYDNVCCHRAFLDLGSSFLSNYQYQHRLVSPDFSPNNPHSYSHVFWDRPIWHCSREILCANIKKYCMLKSKKHKRKQ